MTGIIVYFTRTHLTHLCYKEDPLLIYSENIFVSLQGLHLKIHQYWYLVSVATAATLTSID